MKWKTIPSYPAYEASESGQIRRGDKVRRTNIKNGYETITVSQNGRARSQSVHRLVYSAFHGPIPPGHHINHINGIRSDNRIENLECVTPTENYAHAKKYLVKRGTRVNTAKFNDELVREIRRRRANGEKRVDLAREFNVLESTIWRMCRGDSWSHVN